MPITRNQHLRIRTIDACLQRRQRKWTLEDLRKECENALWECGWTNDGVSTRTIQRDIELMRSDILGYNAPIVVVDRKYYVYEDPDFSITKLPLSKQDLAELSSAIDIIRNYQGFQSMSGQEDLLARMQDKVQLHESRRQVIYLDTNQRLKGLNFLSPLYDLIIAKHPITVHYQSFKSKKPSIFYISPYILKEFNSRWFLIAYSQKLRNLQTLALDRILSVAKDEKGVYKENDFFDPDKYFNSMIGVTRDLYTRTQKVILKVDKNQAPYIITKPLHFSQELLTQNEDGSIVVSLDVVLNQELERLLIGFCPHIEVVSPDPLRYNIAHAIFSSAKMYQRKRKGEKGQQEQKQGKQGKQKEKKQGKKQQGLHKQFQNRQKQQEQKGKEQSTTN